MTTQTSTAAETTATLTYDGKPVTLPLVTGSEGETAIDIQKLRAATGLITLDPGFGNTGACRSAITFIDGEKGILRYRGYAIEELAEKSTFLEVAWLLLHGELPTRGRAGDLHGRRHAAHDAARGLPALLRRAAEGRAPDAGLLRRRSPRWRRSTRSRRPTERTCTRPSCG